MQKKDYTGFAQSRFLRGRTSSLDFNIPKCQKQPKSKEDYELLGEANLHVPVHAPREQPQTAAPITSIVRGPL